MDAQCGEHMRAVAVAEIQQEPLEWRERFLDIAHAITFAELALRRGQLDRIVQAAQLIDQPALHRLRAAPYAALRDRIDVGETLAARARHVADEIAIALLDHALDHR